ncbi:hypothetical protein BKH42_08885 [Helicobacter sp. 13S00482-2]|uniref:hypothetical protein n=1 Tax=Helicobacter sp. 13S00482-2 TaxID=1476200 RepID=UPI000BA509A6|nr:hypothetical protein [Helicobacter sp. 13S00482-2]PAF52901.1 hypothetical protein BKH42_08885 [Helicobacter sp. 13S00482-2]
MAIQQEDNDILLPKIYSMWPEGDDGVNVTQEAWVKGEFFNKEQTIKIYKHPQYGYIKVFMGEEGYIHGYPIKTLYSQNLISVIRDFSDKDIVRLCKLLRSNHSIFNFALGNYPYSPIGFAEKFWIEKFKILKLPIDAFSDFNYSVCWTLLFRLTRQVLKLQISIIAPFAKIELLKDEYIDENLIKQIEHILIENDYILLSDKQLQLEVEGIELDNSQKNINVSRCLFEEY